MNAHVRHPLVPAGASALGPAETIALEKIQRAVRNGRSPSAQAVADYVKCGDNPAYGAQIIESLIRKGYLARQYTVLLPLRLEYAE